MQDETVSRLSRTALVAAAVLALLSVGVSVWRSQAPPAAPVEASAPAPADPAAQIAALEARLKANPSDPQGWAQLAEGFYAGGRYGEAATAYKRATSLDASVASYWSALGEALVLAGKPETRMAADARAAFAKAVSLDAKDPRARYFLGVARDMDGDHKGAIDDWFALLKDTPVGAPWESEVRRLIATVGAKNKIEVATRLAASVPVAAAPGVAGAAIPGPSSEQMRAASSLPPGQQEAMIAQMVEGLATKLKTNPGNVDGWIMLMRSRVQLGQQVAAKTALRDALAANPGASAKLNGAAAELGL